MRTRLAGVLIGVCSAVLVLGGCATKEVVKDEPMAKPAVSAPEKAPTPPPKPAAVEKAPESTVRPVEIAKEDVAPATAGTATPETEKALSKIFFDFDSYLLSGAARDTLSSNAGLIMKQLPGTIQIEGHCDERGSDEYNLALGEKRAKAAMNYLVSLGVPEARLSIISYGKERPVDPGHDEAAWAKNRRAEFVIIVK